MWNGRDLFTGEASEASEPKNENTLEIINVDKNTKVLFLFSLSAVDYLLGCSFLFAGRFVYFRRQRPGRSRGFFQDSAGDFAGDSAGDFPRFFHQLSAFCQRSTE